MSFIWIIVVVLKICFPVSKVLTSTQFHLLFEVLNQWHDFAFKFIFVYSIALPNVVLYLVTYVFVYVLCTYTVVRMGNEPRLRCAMEPSELRLAVSRTSQSRAAYAPVNTAQRLFTTADRTHDTQIISIDI